MKFACHTITWGRDLASALADIRAAGYQGFESFNPVMYGNETDFRSLVATSGLEVASIYAAGSFIFPEQAEEEIALFSRLAQLIASLGGKDLIFGGGHRRPEGNTRADYENMAQALNHIGRIAQAHGLRASYHPHAGTCVASGAEIDLIMELTDPSLISLCPDIGHLLLGGVEPVAFLRQHLSRISYLHIKDLDDDNRSVELGTGRVNLPAILKLFQDDNFTGWITVGLDASPTTPRASAAANLRYLQQHL
jgi:inosose dehydratase